MVFWPAQNNYMLDGIDNNSDTVDFLNGTNYARFSIEAVQEFKVETSGFSAEFGRSAGARRLNEVQQEQKNWTIENLMNKNGYIAWYD